MGIDRAIALIDQHLGPAVVDICFEGLKNEWNYDEQLIIDIGTAIESWIKRTGGPVKL